MDSTLQGFAITLAVLTALFAAGFAAYNAGLLDPIIEKIGYVCVYSRLKWSCPSRVSVLFFILSYLNETIVTPGLQETKGA